MIKMKEIYFGAIDARNEVFSQEREEIDIFNTAFVVPPSVNLDQILNGSKYFITGSKGSGKTALLMHIKYLIQREKGTRTHTTLFKTDLTEVERQKLIHLKDVSIDEGLKSIEDSYDYKQQWMWYVYTKVISLINDEFVISGIKELNAIRKIVGIDNFQKTSVFSGLKLSKIKSKIRAAITSGIISAEVASEFDLDEIGNKDENVAETINIIEDKFSSVHLNPDLRICIFFDELELFVDKPDRKERDLRLIRDLVYAINRVNRRISGGYTKVYIYAALRTEVLSELNRLDPESKRSIKDFSTNISWNIRSEASGHPLLSIFEKKINESELAAGSSKTIDVWREYFPHDFKGKEFKKFLLDVSMLKPRNIVRFLNIVKENNPEVKSVKDVNMDEYMTPFSLEIWEEIEEELMTSRDKSFSGAIKIILTCIKPSFDVRYFESVILDKLKNDLILRKYSQRDFDVTYILETLYRLGAIGNKTRRSRKFRGGIDRWVFRDYPDPDFSQNFVIHQSLKKILQVQDGHQSPSTI